MKSFYGGISGFFSKITKEEKNNLYIMAISLILLCVFLFFICIPQQKLFSSKINEVHKTEKQIAEIMLIAQGKDLAQAVKALNINLIEFSGKLPAEEEAIIYRLSDSAKKLRLNVMNITPGEKVLVAHKASGFDIEERPLTMTLVGDFRALGEYINELEQGEPTLVKIKKVEVKNKGEYKALLDIKLELSAYMATERK